MSTHSSSFAITGFSKLTAALTGSAALALVGGYLAFGAFSTDARTSVGAPVMAVADSAGTEMTQTRRGLRSMVMAADTSFVPEQQAMLTPDGKEMTRRGLRPAPELAGLSDSAGGASIWQASLAIDGAEITRRGLR